MFDLEAFFSEVDEEWMEMAECKGMDPDFFYPAQGDIVGVRKAKAVCAQCIVSDFCFDYAVRMGEYQGIWGGKTVRDFRNVRLGRQEVA